jgi:hypothetical protein
MMARRILGLDLDYRSSRSFVLWFGLLAPPLAWGAHLLMGDGIFELGCTRAFSEKAILGVPLAVAAVIETVVMAAISVVAGVLALLAWRGLRREADGTSHGRATAMAVMGMASGLFYFLIILFGLLPPILLRACETSL